MFDHFLETALSIAGARNLEIILINSFLTPHISSTINVKHLYYL